MSTCLHTDAAARLRAAALRATREHALALAAGTATVVWCEESCTCGERLARTVRCVGARVDERDGMISVCCRCVDPAVTRGAGVSHGMCLRHHAEEMAMIGRLRE